MPHNTYVGIKKLEDVRTLQIDAFNLHFTICVIRSTI